MKCEKVEMKMHEPRGAGLECSPLALLGQIASGGTRGAGLGCPPPALLDQVASRDTWSASFLMELEVQAVMIAKEESRCRREQEEKKHQGIRDKEILQSELKQE